MAALYYDNTNNKTQNKNTNKVSQKKQKQVIGR